MIDISCFTADGKETLSHGDTVKTQVYLEETVSDEFLRFTWRLHSYPNLRRLELTCSPISDISWLEAFSCLTHLCISYTNVTDIAVLSQLTSLEELVMNELSLENLEPIRGLKSLKVLHLLYSNVRDISAIAELSPSLRLVLPETMGGDLASLKLLKWVYTFSPCFYMMAPDNRRVKVSNRSNLYSGLSFIETCKSVL